jgi:hypothetical protein
MRLLILFSIFLLNGCGSTSSVRADAPITKTTSFIFYDNRPDDQKIEVGNKVPDGTKHYYDNMLTPPPPVLIKSALHTKLDKPLTSKTVTLKSFEVSVYDGSLYGSSKFSVKPSEIPLAIIFAPLIAIAAIESGVDGVNAKQLVSVQIEMDINDSPFSSGSSNEYEGHVSDANVSETIKQALDGLVTNIQSRLP